MKWLIKASLVLFTLYGVVFLDSQSIGAEEQTPFYWKYINVDIDVQENGDMLITETQKYVFTGPHTNERYRWIPLNKGTRSLA